jgi:hypothetical protein
MPKAKNAPLLKSAPGNILKALGYFADGDIDPEAVWVAYEMRSKNVDMLESSPPMEFGMGEYRLAKAFHAKDAAFLRAVADAVDLERKYPGRPVHLLAYHVCRAYLSARNTITTPIVRRIRTGAEWEALMRRIRADGTYPADAGPGLRPSFRAMLAELRSVPELHDFFNPPDRSAPVSGAVPHFLHKALRTAEGRQRKQHVRANQERAIRRIADKLGLKFEGRTGRPRK